MNGVWHIVDFIWHIAVAIHVFLAFSRYFFLTSCLCRQRKNNNIFNIVGCSLQISPPPPLKCKVYTSDFKSVDLHGFFLCLHQIILENDQAYKSFIFLSILLSQIANWLSWFCIINLPITLFFIMCQIIKLISHHIVTKSFLS